MTHVDGRAALVTGGASGIGRATVERLRAAGWSVVLADLHAERGASAAAEIGGPVRFVRADVAEEADVAAAVDATVSAFGRLDCVVNNAGVGGAFGPITPRSRSRTGTTHVRRARAQRLPRDQARRPGDAGGRARWVDREHRVDRGLLGGRRAAGVLGGESRGDQPRPGRRCGAGRGPDPVNTVCPGLIVTPLVGATEERAGAVMAAAQPWPDLGRPADVAEVITFLAGDAAQDPSARTCRPVPAKVPFRPRERCIPSARTCCPVSGRSDGTARSAGRSAPLAGRSPACIRGGR